jgi:hypothetical protein
VMHIYQSNAVMSKVPSIHEYSFHFSLRLHSKGYTHRSLLNLE